MTSIGDTLRGAREEKGLSFERVAEETNIAKRYLVALETEDFGVFPGDPYAIGFLRNYADYLGLPADSLVASFKNLRIQEQPLPLQELIPNPRPRLGLVIGLSLGAAALLGLGLFLVLGSASRRQDDAAAEAARGPVEYRVESAAFEKRLYPGDSLLVGTKGESYKLLVARIDEAVSFETPLGARRLSLGEEGLVDFDKDGVAELKILVADLDKKDASRGALLRLQVEGAPLAAESPASGEPAAAGPGATATTGTASAAPALAPSASAALPPEPPAPAGARNLVLFEAGKSPYPFVLSVTFRGPSMFRYEIDRRDRDERYYHKGETITVNANNSAKIWASNAQSAKVVIQASGGKSVDLDLGGAGEVAVKRLAWVQNEAGGYALTAFDVD